MGEKHSWISDTPHYSNLFCLLIVYSYETENIIQITFKVRAKIVKNVWHCVGHSFIVSKSIYISICSSKSIIVNTLYIQNLYIPVHQSTHLSISERILFIFNIYLSISISILLFIFNISIHPIKKSYQNLIKIYLRYRIR